MTIRQHLTQQGMLMKRGMATSRLYTSPYDMGFGLKSYVGVYLLELVRLPPVQVGNHLPSGVVLEDGGADQTKRKRRLDAIEGIVKLPPLFSKQGGCDGLTGGWFCKQPP